MTEEVAEDFGQLALLIRKRGHDPHDVAHFLMKCMFCLFAEDIALLPGRLFERLLKSRRTDPAKLTRALTDLFKEMQSGGSFGVDDIAHFNGGLFDDSPALELTGDEIDVLLAAARQDWGSVEPAIFGTLFERSLDPNTRAQIGAHYTSRDDIMLVVEPVVMAPLRREWEEAQAEVDKQLARRRKVKTKKRTADKAIEGALQGFVHRLATVRILDPACGSGNFLYVAIQQLLDLEKEVITFAARPDVGLGLFPQVRPTQLHGIEINPYAAELAQVVIWIGYLQWMRDNGFIEGVRKPILEPLQTIECRDAILDLSNPDKPRQATWPEADFIIGNPPFLGSKLFRQQGLEDSYIDAMYTAFDVPNASDLCCYWFELARRAIEQKPDTRAGLLATQGIRGGANRKVLERIKHTGDIFIAWSDRAWILDGAAVHVSIVAFDAGEETDRILDGANVQRINVNLSGDIDLTNSRALPENRRVAYIGACKKGKFELSVVQARQLLGKCGNPNGRPNADVLRPWFNGIDLVRRYGGDWIIDFGVNRPVNDASMYEAPFAVVLRRVKPCRDKVRVQFERERWWLLARPVPDVRDALLGIERFIATPTLSQYRIFTFLKPTDLPSHQTVVFARGDDYFFGVLQSAVHVMWSLRQGTQLETRPRYTPTTSFETFPLPWAPGEEPTGDPLHTAIADAAKELNEQRERWLNPPEWIEPIAAAVDADDDFSDVPAEARELIRQSAIMARAAQDNNLKRRTLTNLYNERPMWLRLAHERLDRAVLAAYAAVDPEGDWSPDWAEVWTETGAGRPLPPDPDLAPRRLEIDQRLLASLLRLNILRLNLARTAKG